MGRPFSGQSCEICPLSRKTVPQQTKFHFFFLSWGGEKTLSHKQCERDPPGDRRIRGMEISSREHSKDAFGPLPEPS